MKNTFRIFLFFALIMSILFLTNATYLQDNNEPINTSDTYKIKALKLPQNLNLAGERVPLEKEDIKERMDRELLVNTYWQSNGLLLIKRANKYFPLLEPLLKKYGLPDDFKYLCVAESALIDETSSCIRTIIM